MVTTTIATLTGPDRSGLLQLLAKLTHEHHGVWRQSKVINVGGQTAILLEIAVSEESLSSLQQQFLAITNLHCHFSAPKDVTGLNAEAIISIDANDRPGIMHDVTQALLELDINITHSEQQRMSATNLDSPVLRAKLTLSLPAGVTPASVVSALESLPGQIKASAG